MEMYDVVIIGGGPAGSCCGSLLRKYDPSLRVAIFEREKFPRDHIGESLLPAVCQVLNEMNAWDKVERANFPIKIGATYRWGATKELWDFEFLPGRDFKDDPRPGRFAGQRALTAFQVDRAIYDEILIDHAAEMGCEVREETKVVEINKTGDHIDSVKLGTGEVIEAKYFIDASGVSGIIRRAMDVGVDYPTTLRNIAIWDYYQNADWAVNIGVGGTRITVMSLGYGWIWFIPIGPTRTSIGLVIPLEYYKESGKRPEELFLQGLAEEPLISQLIKNGTRENRLTTTNDWSYIADRLCGDNWFLIGDTCGFADPILSAGMTLAMMGARQVAYSILAMERKEHEKQWLMDFYNDSHRKRIRQHVLFADFWYTSNGQFTDLIDYTKEIAETSGLNLTPDEAFRWLGTGGFAHEDPAAAMVGGFPVQAVQAVNQKFSQQSVTWQVAENNVFKLNLEGAVEDTMPIFFEGKIWPKTCYRRDGKILPKYGVFDIAVKLLEKEQFIVPAVDRLRAFFQRTPIYSSPDVGIQMTLSTMEAMIADGWITASVDTTQPFFPFSIAEESEAIHRNLDFAVAV